MAKSVAGAHDGHRERMREKFRKNGFNGMAEHEILEVLLFYALPRVNTNEIAHMLIKHFEETAIEPGKYPVYISHGDCLEDAEYVAAKLKEKCGVKEVLVHMLEPVIGAHAGPGTVALFFLGEHR